MLIIHIFNVSADPIVRINDYLLDSPYFIKCNVTNYKPNIRI